MTILIVNKVELEKKVGRSGTYKAVSLSSSNMFPSDLSGSLDDFYFLKFMKGGRFKYL